MNLIKGETEERVKDSNWLMKSEKHEAYPIFKFGDNVQIYLSESQFQGLDYMHDIWKLMTGVLTILASKIAINSRIK